jgi:hypothetical protein
MRTALPPRFLSHAELDTVIRLAPLIAIDLIIRNARDEHSLVCAGTSRPRAVILFPEA